MKFYIRISFLLTVLVAGGSCNKFLDEKAYSFFTPENLFKTDVDAELALTGLYDVLTTPSVAGGGSHSLWSRGMHYLNGTGNDELITIFNAADIHYTNLSDYSYSPSNAITSNAWLVLYAGINRANTVIERVPSIIMDKTRKEQILGEAYFLRGMFNFYLGTLFGGVPVVIDTKIELQKPRNTLIEVMGQCEKDFKYAYKVLPSRNPKIGRINKYSAAGFLAKTYLYLGSCKEYNVGSTVDAPLNKFDGINAVAMYDSAIVYCQDIYNNSGYKLISDYRFLFLAVSEEEARNELMVIVQVGPGGTNSESIQFGSLTGPGGNPGINGGTNGRIRPLRELYDKYNSDDVRRSHNMTGALGTSVANFTFINGVKFYTPANLNTSSFSPFHLGKYRDADPQHKISRGMSTSQGETDFGILRYADILLMYAELKFKKGDLEGASDLMRQIRRRASNNDDPTLTKLTTAYTKSDFMQELMDERARELCGEGWRRFDLIRTNKLEATVLSLKPSGSASNTTYVPLMKANFQPYKIWYPVPQREIDLNKNLIQNPGY